MKKGQCIKIKEFKYTETKLSKVNRQIKNSQDIPLKSLVKKMQGQLHQEGQEEINFINQQENIQLLERRKTMSLKKMLTPRDQLYEAKPYLFDRFNYENYSNYIYRNPFKPSKFKPQYTAMKTVRKDPKKGTSKNIQIIFCENKFQQFVEKTNQQLQESYKNKSKENSHEKTNYNKNKKCNTIEMVKSKSLPFNKIQQNTLTKSISIHKHPKTTLSKCMQQFNTLQKLSYFMQKQQKLNQKYLLMNSFNDSSKTVLVEILSHRFNFLNQIKKKTKLSIFKILLGVNSILPTTKFNIQQYLKFLKLFVYRDASQHQLALFVFNFIFRQKQSINFQNTKNIINMLPGSSLKHIEADAFLQKIIMQSHGTQQSIFRSILANMGFTHCIIDLIVGK